MICPMLMIVDLEFETKAKFYCSLWFLNMRCDNVCWIYSFAGMSDEFIISQTRRFLKRENCTGLWPQCRAFSCTSNDQDHNEARHQNATRTTLSDPRRVSSHAGSSIRSYTNTHRFPCEQRLPSAHMATTSGHRMTSSRSWLWQRQYSSESNNTPKKKGLLESQIGQELMTEAAEQNSTPGSFEGKFTFRHLIFCLLKPQLVLAAIWCRHNVWCAGVVCIRILDSSLHCECVFAGLDGKLSSDEEAALMEAEAEFEKAQQGKGDWLALEKSLCIW